MSAWKDESLERRHGQLLFCLVEFCLFDNFQLKDAYVARGVLIL